MISLAFETPDGMLQQLQPLGDFDWVLAHRLSESKAYLEYYRSLEEAEATVSERPRFKVLDTSTNELFAPVGIQQLACAAYLCRPDYVVAPDWLLDAQKTVDSLNEFESSLHFFPGGTQILPVIQGVTVEVCLWSVSVYLNKGCNVLSIPYDITVTRDIDTERMSQARQGLLEQILLDFPGVLNWIHLLGFTNIEEMNKISRKSLENPTICFSLDTGFPIMQGLQGKELYKNEDRYKKIPTYNQMKDISYADAEAKDLLLVHRNIALVRKEANNHARLFGLDGF